MLLSRSAIYRRKKQARELGVSLSQLPDRRGKHGHHQHGARHHRWKSGRIVSSNGYVKIRVGREHPLADPNGYAYEHLLVWVSAGRPKPPQGFVLHHENKQKQDNRLENLRQKSRGGHNRLHNAARGRDALGHFREASYAAARAVA